jgi:hypothetical protein
MNPNLFETLTAKFPFLSVILYGVKQDEFIGIVQNIDTSITSFYDVNKLKTDDEKRLFLLLGEKWYFESNRQLPINIYLKDEWLPFKKIFRTFISKEVTIIHGPVTSLSNLAQKKRRRNITVIKKL